MKIVISVVLLCTLQSTLVSARTFDDIATDFKKYILEFHNTLAKEAHFLVRMEDGVQQTSEYQRDAALMSWTFDRKLNWIEESIKNAVRNIILETDMSSHEDLIKHCQDTRYSEFYKLVDVAGTNQNVCVQIGQQGALELEAILKEIYDRQNPMHTKLDQIIPDCLAASTTNSKLVSCLVENLYDKMGPEMAQLMKRMRDDVANMVVTITEKLNNIQTCFTVITTEAEGRMDSIINGFRDCCIAASPGIH